MTDVMFTKATSRHNANKSLPRYARIVNHLCHCTYAIPNWEGTAHLLSKYHARCFQEPRLITYAHNMGYLDLHTYEGETPVYVLSKLGHSVKHLYPDRDASHTDMMLCRCGNWGVKSDALYWCYFCKSYFSDGG